MHTAYTKRILFFACFLLALLLCTTPALSKDFVVVIDAGHGGHDSGAARKGVKEKDINLKVALALGREIRKNAPDVKVIYTRKSDVFIELNQRAAIANKANADLFISIHTNAVKRGSPVGSETFTLGLSRSKANLEVAKRENSVIEIEDNYKQKYAGFDPSSPESYIIFEFIQDKHMKQSVALATLVQKEFKTYAKRVDRGVHQAGFLVLKATSMPSILIELGFITSKRERDYLRSTKGANKMAESIYRAFAKYRKEQPQYLAAKKTFSSTNSPKPTTYSTPTNTTKGTYFRVQIMTSSKKLSLRDYRFHRQKGISYYYENGRYKYTIGNSTNYDEIYALSKKMKRIFKDAFIVAFTNNKKTNIHKAIQLYKKNK